MGVSQMSDSLYPNKKEVLGLLQQILINGFSLDLNNSKSRKDMLEISRSLFLALETPMEAVLRMGWAEKPLMPLICTAINLNLFSKMDENDATPKSCQQLASMTNSDPILLGRILRHLSAMSIIKETGPDVYVHTRFSKSMLNPVYSSGFPFLETTFSDTYHALPSFLSDNKYRNCTDPMNTAFQAGHHTTLHTFEWFTETPGVLELFNNHMAGYSMSRSRWMDEGCYPVEQNLGTELSSEQRAVLLVDVGGGTGHDIAEFYTQHNGLSGRLILQDTPPVIESAENLPDKIEKMPHDFFTEQPVQGARAYYLHSVLHDWPDSRCLDILRNLKPALKSGYSKVLINENVIPAQNAHYTTTGLDMLMMSAFASTERTEDSWRKLLEAAGLKIIKIWTFERGTESLIEAELA